MTMITSTQPRPLTAACGVCVCVCVCATIIHDPVSHTTSNDAVWTSLYLYSTCHKKKGFLLFPCSMIMTAVTCDSMQHDVIRMGGFDHEP